MSFPYIHVPSLDLGPIEIQPFGVLVASGVLLGTWMARKYAERNRMDEETLRFLGIRLLIIGFVACHVFNVLFYDLDRAMGPFKDFEKEPGWVLWFKVWDGISSWGGIVGGVVGFLWYSRRLGLDRLVWADLLSWGVIGGWLPGRAACAVVHDHTAGPTDFFLGIAVPNPPPEHTPSLVAQYAGQTIHDLGLYETLILIPIFATIVLAERLRNRKPGVLIGLLAVLYSAPRFFLDFLRFEKTDPRYGGLTFAQWCCIVAFVAGVTFLFWRRRVAAGEAAAGDEPRPAHGEARAGGERGGGKPRRGRRR
jgi:phosphatidylglycerol:prolipoprotein diacylglycerol transferase